MNYKKNEANTLKIFFWLNEINIFVELDKKVDIDLIKMDTNWICQLEVNYYTQIDSWLIRICSRIHHEYGAIKTGGTL